MMRQLKKYDTHFDGFEMIDRFAFYERAKKAYAIVATSESALLWQYHFKKGCGYGLTHDETNILFE